MNLWCEISRVLANVRHVQEYTWHAISGTYLYSEKRHWHSACGHGYTDSCWEKEPMQISKSKESDTLLVAVGSHQENVEASARRSREKAQETVACLFLESACVQGHMCVLPCVSLSQPRELKEQNKPEVAWQHKTLPNVNFEDTGAAGGGKREKKNMESSTREAKSVLL